MEYTKELDSNVYRYWNDNGILPEKILDLENPKKYSPIIEYENYLNGVGISYKKIDGKRFQICNDLKHAVRLQDFVRWSYQRENLDKELWKEWVRPKGHHCFERTIDTN
ncbi:MAG: hypothetical protein AAB884_01840 [Patescibacteria group bacterium]